MPPRRRAEPTGSLTADDVASLEATLAAGKNATVYLRDPVPSLNLPAGASAKVVRFADGGVVVRPRGVDDELPFELEEVRSTRSAPAPVAPPKRPARPKRPAVEATPAAADPVPPERPAPARPRRPAKKLADGVLVTIHGGTDNAWTVGVSYGPRPPGKANPVAPDAVERALAQLGDEPARAAVDSVLVAAREAVANRIEELNRQLADARAALAALGSGD